MTDPLGRALFENQAIGHDCIEFVNWPENFNHIHLALAKYEWWLLRNKYFKMMKLGEEVIKLLEKR